MAPAGSSVSLREAFEHGLVDELVTTHDEAEKHARAWISNNLEPVQPFERDGRNFGAHHLSREDRVSLQMAAARTRKLGGKNNAAAVRIADVAVQSLYLPWEVISRIETRAFVALVMSDEAQGRIADFFSRQRERT